MKYDVLYRNGKIFTSDKENLYAEAMAVKRRKDSMGRKGC